MPEELEVAPGTRESKMKRDMGGLNVSEGLGRCGLVWMGWMGWMCGALEWVDAPLLTLLDFTSSQAIKTSSCAV